MKRYTPTRREEELASMIVDSAYTVHKELGPGLLEKVYEICFCHELAKRKVKFRRQLPVPVEYDGLRFDEGFRLDVLIENCIICELKAVEEMNDIWTAQILSHLKMMGLHLGFLINFNVVLFKEIQRKII